ncbi:hypothetical protein KUV51_17580 [Tateyamaria omphalii]|uniref:hypothetical protein n=1 Tax=Tateyamaria omphalii TaxID=299262 RepID=UPI001C994BB0|nr:hypothetical protein [Tateyamaria omphalii]MBY5934823.1 hypothetical protein [Tateyamaria omphalii]
MRFPDAIPTVFTGGRMNVFYMREDIANILRQHNLGDAALLPVDIYDADGLNTYDERAYLLAPGTFRPTVDIRASRLRRNRYASKPEFSLYYDAETWRDLTPLAQPDDGLAVWWDDKIINTVFFQRGAGGRPERNRARTGCHRGQDRTGSALNAVACQPDINPLTPRPASKTVFNPRPPIPIRPRVASAPESGRQ